MKIHFKKVCAVCALAAIVVSAGAALGKTAYPCTGVWNYGTTGKLGGGTVYSNYECYEHEYSRASVKNAKGATDSETKQWDEAKASEKAYNLKTDFSYYSCWD